MTPLLNAYVFQYSLSFLYQNFSGFGMGVIGVKGDGMKVFIFFFIGRLDVFNLTYCMKRKRMIIVQILVVAYSMILTNSVLYIKT